MNRVVGFKGHGLDNVEFQWNHDIFGYEKLKSYLPPRVQDIMKLHSLREIPAMTTRRGNWNPNDEGNDGRVKNATITRADQGRLHDHLSAQDVERARFIQHFSIFDAKTKVITDNIPRVDMVEIKKVLWHYFPGGKIVW